MLVPSVVAFLRRDPERRWLLKLGPLPAGSVLWDGLRGLGPTERCVYPSRSSHFFDCTVPHNELLSKLPKRFRRSLRSGYHALEALEGVRFASVAGDGDIEAELDAFLAVEASGWKGQEGKGSAIRLHPDLAGFYRDLATASPDSGDLCEINSLYIEGRCAASQFCVRTGGDYAMLKIGYDETFAGLRPGQLLLDRTLERCCTDEGISRLDLCSDSAWHDVWKPDEMPMQVAHVAIGRLAGRPTTSYLSLRYGPARRVVRRLRRGMK